MENENGSLIINHVERAKNGNLFDGEEDPWGNPGIAEDEELVSTDDKGQEITIEKFDKTLKHVKEDKASGFYGYLANR